MAAAPLRVFLSHTAELRRHPVGDSFVRAAERAVTKAGHAIVDMEYFTSRDMKPAAYCRAKVVDCNVFVGLLGFRYGSPVRDEPDKSYVELEYQTARDLELPCLMFLLSEDPTVALPVDAVTDTEFGARQAEFRKAPEGTRAKFTSPQHLETLLYQALVELAADSPQSGSPHGSRLGALPLLDGLVDQDANSLRDVLTAVVGTHARSAGEQPASEDPWRIPNFAQTVLSQRLGDLRHCWIDGLLAGDRLLVQVVLLYIDAVLLSEYLPRRTALDQAEVDDPVIRADLARVSRLIPAAASSGTADKNPILLSWAAHQAALRSPSVWEGDVARQLAMELAGLLEQRSGYQEELANILRRLGRDAAYESHEPTVDEVTILLPSTTSALTARLGVVALALRFAWQAILDPRQIGQPLVDQAAVATNFDAAASISELQNCQWIMEGRRIELDGWCGHPAVGQALIEYAEVLDQLVDDLRREPLSPIHRDLHVGTARLRPRTVDGVPVFEFPLVQLRLSQQEVRALLMGTALYGNPELAIRELYQNAMDACRYRVVRDKYLRLTDQPGRPSYAPRVEIRQEPPADGRIRITCTDNGVGMSYVQVRDAFAKAGRRFTDLPDFQDEQARWQTADRDLKLFPNSRFGIGVFSYFMLAEEINIVTVREGPNGQLESPLGVHVVARSALVTITHPQQVPEDLISGGTKVELVVPLANATSDGPLSIADTLDRLIWLSEVDLTVVEGGRETLSWSPGELKVPGNPATHLAFEADGSRGWWCEQGGGVLADGIKTDIDLTGLIVDMRSTHAPRLSVDRNVVQAWDQDWALQNFIQAASNIEAWSMSSLAWLWQIALTWPILGEALAAHISEIRIGLGEAPETIVPLREFGCYPGDGHMLDHRFTLRSPWPSTPKPLPEVYTNIRAVGWPRVLEAWRRSLWSPKLSGVTTYGDRSEFWPQADTGWPIPTSIDAALLVTSQAEHFFRPRNKRAGLEGMSLGLAGLFAGACRLQQDLAWALRRVRRFTISGIFVPNVDARDYLNVQIGGDIAEMVAAALWSYTEHWAPMQDSTIADWGRAVIIAAHTLRYPLGMVWPVLDVLRVTGVEPPALPGDLVDWIPTSQDAAIICGRHGRLNLADIVQSASQAGLRDAPALKRVLGKYSSILLAMGVDLDLVDAIYGALTEQELIAWSENLDGRAPFIYGQRISRSHIIKVSEQLSVSLAEAYDLIARCPGAVIADPRAGFSETYVADAQSAELLRWKDLTDPSRKNLYYFASEMDFMALQAEEAVRLLRVISGEELGYLENIDWQAVGQFALTYQQRELLNEPDPSYDDVDVPSAGKIGIRRILEVAEKLNLPVAELCTHASPLEKIGVIVNLPNGEPPGGVPDYWDIAVVRKLTSFGPRRWLLATTELADLPEEVWFERFLEIVDWVRWLWPQIAGGMCPGEAIARFADQLDEEQVSSLSLDLLRLVFGGEEASVCGSDVFQLAARLGMSISQLRSYLEPFEELLTLSGLQVEWIDDPTQKPPTWVDVIVRVLFESQRELIERDGMEYLLANVPAEADEIKHSLLTWCGYAID